MVQAKLFFSGGSILLWAEAPELSKLSKPRRAQAQGQGQDEWFPQSGWDGSLAMMPWCNNVIFVRPKPATM